MSFAQCHCCVLCLEVAEKLPPPEEGDAGSMTQEELQTALQESNAAAKPEARVLQLRVSLMFTWYSNVHIASNNWHDGEYPRSLAINCTSRR